MSDFVGSLGGPHNSGFKKKLRVLNPAGLGMFYQSALGRVSIQADTGRTSLGGRERRFGLE